MENENHISEKSRISDSVVLEAPVRVYGVAEVRDRSTVGRYTSIHTRSTAFKDTVIGRYCSIEKMCEIGAYDHPTDWLSSSPFQYNRNHFPDIPEEVQQLKLKRPKGVTIGSDVWIGNGSIIKRGITVGHGAIIGAQSLVTKDVPDYAVVMGTPAKVMKYRFDESTISRLLATRWWELETQQIANITFNDIEMALSQLETIRGIAIRVRDIDADTNEVLSVTRG